MIIGEKKYSKCLCKFMNVVHINVQDDKFFKKNDSNSRNVVGLNVIEMLLAATASVPFE